MAKPPAPSRKDSFFDGQGKKRPAGDYEDNYAAGDVEGGFRERAANRGDDHEDVAGPNEGRMIDRRRPGAKSAAKDEFDQEEPT